MKLKKIFVGKNFRRQNFWSVKNIRHQGKNLSLFTDGLFTDGIRNQVSLRDPKQPSCFLNPINRKSFIHFARELRIEN